MKANTIRLEQDLLRELYPLLKPKQSLASFVREALRRDIQRQKMLRGAGQYLNFLKNNAEERESLEEWSEVDLTQAPKTKSRKKK